jgi:hypothetical protein
VPHHPSNIRVMDGKVHGWTMSLRIASTSKLIRACKQPRPPTQRTRGSYTPFTGWGHRHARISNAKGDIVGNSTVASPSIWPRSESRRTISRRKGQRAWISRRTMPGSRDSSASGGHDHHPFRWSLMIDCTMHRDRGKSRMMSPISPKRTHISNMT